MAVFVLILVGLVVSLTWLDWRDTRKDWVIPDWAKGMALGGVLAASLAAASSFASIWLRDEAGQWPGALDSHLVWPEIALLICAMGAIIVATRKKRLHLALLIAGVLVAAFWLGLTL